MPSQVSEAKLNNFADYAISGMPSNKVKNWKMSGYDLLPFAGKQIEISFQSSNKRFEAHILIE